jgi:hypothetical protein
MRNALLVLSGFFATGTTTAQIDIQNTSTPEDLVQNVLLGSGVQIFNVTFNGVPGSSVNEQIGFFDGENCNVGIDYGVLLATGSVFNAEGPNDIGSSTTGGGFNGQSDPDLVAIGNSPNINDAAVLEFDFIAISDTILFDFVFASDEYLEFVNSSFNDVFGFFLSGPGISGPYSDNAINIALIPGSLVPVSIDNVNNGTNADYYVDNGDGFSAPYSTDPHYIQYDGFTVPITVIATVVPGAMHHIKLTVGDAGDAAYDSAVFLSGGTFMSPLEDTSTGLAGQPGSANTIATAPNPATNRVQLSYGAEGPVTIRVYDSLGREVVNMNGKTTSPGIHNETLDVSGWPAGYYRVTITSQEGDMRASTLVVAR